MTAKLSATSLIRHHVTTEWRRQMLLLHRTAACAPLYRQTLRLNHLQISAAQTRAEFVRANQYSSAPSAALYKSKNSQPTPPSMAGTFYDLTPVDDKGKPFSFKQLENKAVLIVNVASKCGFTKQYKELEALYKEYKDKGFVIIGFPCNQFGGQEPGTSEEIASFCSLNYGVTFPIMQKIDVNGNDSDPVYKWLKSQKSGFLGFTGIKWNFEKFLVDPKGHVVERWSSLTNPTSLKDAIEAVLPKST